MHPSSPKEAQVYDSGYGIFSPRRNKKDVQSKVWDSRNGHYSLSERNQGNGVTTTDADLNNQPKTHIGVNSVWNSPVSGFESFADKIKKSNEIEGFELEYFPPSCTNKPKPMEEVISEPGLVKEPDSGVLDRISWGRNGDLNRTGLEEAVLTPMLNHKEQRICGARHGGTVGFWLIYTFVNTSEYSMMRIHVQIVTKYIHPTILVYLAPRTVTIEGGAAIAPLAGDATITDAVMTSRMHPSSPKEAQVYDSGYGIFSPRRNKKDVQSKVWDSRNGHYSLSERNQGVLDRISWGRNGDLNRTGLEEAVLTPMLNHKEQRICGARHGGTVGFWLIYTFVNTSEYSMMRIHVQIVTKYIHPTILVYLAPRTVTIEGGAAIAPLAGDATITDVVMTSRMHPSSPKEAQVYDSGYGIFSPRRNKKDVQSKVWDSRNGHYSLSERNQGNGVTTTDADLNNQPKTHIGVNSVWNSPVSGFESFADKIKKSNEIEGFELEYFPPSSGVGSRARGLPSAVRQEVTVRGASKPASDAPMASKGFDFSRAVNGTCGITVSDQNRLDHRVQSRDAHLAPSLSTTSGPRPLTPGVIPSVPKQLQSTPNLVSTQNRFAVLDLPNSLKFKQLVESNEDLYPCDMEPDGGERSKGPGIADQEKNRSLESPVLMEREIKDYGITNSQKMSITSRLCGPSKAVRAIDMDGWEQGEHEFFEDQVKALGLDYDYCIEDVESDDENGTTQFFAAQMKVGMPKVPLPIPPHPPK
ncbi:hypothetical protein L1987_42301 [Smallanthus sonchifolius]|uniref:Uncharacterized protein n=1 Tax=Smallanthus sonchifolius TaxID=185202 RepID=A0ACB9GWS8_9ASTR|nr:hypothetical protein L1987_42301 [Smallanthus sonchifolius]